MSKSASPDLTDFAGNDDELARRFSAHLLSLNTPYDLAREGIYWLYRIATNVGRFVDALEKDLS
jgi:hypothetical protein